MNNLAVAKQGLQLLLQLQRADSAHRAGLSLVSSSANDLGATAGDFLHHQEWHRWQSFSHRRRADDYLRGRHSAKQAVSVLYPDQIANEVIVESGVFQQPLLVCPSDPMLRISLSHASSLTAAVAFPAAHPMAIDVETIDSSHLPELKSQLTSAEVKLLTKFGSFSELEAVTAMWTIKEALSKALRSGLTAPVSIYEVAAVTADSGLLRAQFRHFIQYQALCFRCGLAMCSLVLPGRSRLLNDGELVLAGQACA